MMTLTNHENSINEGQEVVSIDNGTTLKLLSGEEVLLLLQEPGFQSDWDALYNACPWGTVFQSRPFVTTWYQIYHHEYLPILIKAESGGRLTGLLAMALQGSSSSKNRRIVGAGHFEAEYQTWLSEEANGEAFIKDALKELWKKFPQHHLMFRFLPERTPLNWLAGDKELNKRSVLEQYSRPLMDFSDPDVSKILRHSQFRNKFNRLKRLGTVHFERITDVGRFSSIVDELTLLFDFRQGAMFNKNHFREDPLKKDLLLAQFKENLLHVTVLKVNEEIIAALAAFTGKGWLHMAGVNCHSPLYTKSNSPGYVHFIMLGQELAQEGFQCFDLTPGYDAYKERLATGHDHVHELVIAGTSSFYYKRLMRTRIQNRLVRAGLRPMSVELEIKRRIYLLRGRGLKASLVHWLKMGQKKEQKLFVVDPASLNAVAFPPLQKDGLRDLLDYEQQRGKLTRWEFMEAAMRNFEQGWHCYTWAEGGRLLGCVWVGRTIPSAEAKDSGPLEDGVVLQELYCHEAGGERLQHFLGAVAAEASANSDSKRVFALAEHAFMHEALQRVGFRSAISE